MGCFFVCLFVFLLNFAIEFICTVVKMHPAAGKISERPLEVREHVEYEEAKGHVIFHRLLSKVSL